MNNYLFQWCFTALDNLFIVMLISLFNFMQPLLCRRLAEVKPDMLPVLPFIQAILPGMIKLIITFYNFVNVNL